MGLGSMGGGTQMLFGGSGGQDIFQKITWVLGMIFMVGSLVLAVSKSRGTSQYLGRTPVQQQQLPTSQPTESTNETA